MGEDAVATKESSDEIGKGAKQVDVSEKRLEKLLGDGFELVTNVKVAGNTREMQHRLQEADNKHARYITLHTLS